MPRAGGFVLVAAVAVVATASASCAVSPPPDREVDRARCTREAGLLAAPADVRAAPSMGARVVVTLAKGAVVYGCGAAEAGFGPVMFPKPGQRAVCASQPASCAAGWIPATVTIESAG